MHILHQLNQYRIKTKANRTEKKQESKFNYFFVTDKHYKKTTKNICSAKLSMTMLIRDEKIKKNLSPVIFDRLIFRNKAILLFILAYVTKWIV